MIRGSSRAIPLLTASLFVACGGEGSTAPPPGPEATISLVAETYLNEALDIMQAHSINRYEIDWPTFRERTFLSAGGAQAVEDTYDAIRFALEMIQDNHSRFVPKGSSEDELDPPLALRQPGWGTYRLPLDTGRCTECQRCPRPDRRLGYARSVWLGCGSQG